MTEPIERPATSERTAPGAAVAYFGLGLVGYWLTRAFLPVELGNLTGPDNLLAREAIAGAVAGGVNWAVALARRVLARRLPELSE